MEFEVVKDQKGREHLGFNKEELNDDDLLGDKLSDFEFLQKLGKGAQGNVYKVCSLINHKIYAMKIIELKEGKTEEEKKENEIEKVYIHNEIEILKKLNHSNISKYYKHFKEGNKIYIVMEYSDNGNLEIYINVLKYLKEQNMIKMDELWNIFYQCMSALEYLHSSNVVHRDIKPSNIFMNKNKIIKLGDFGVSALIKEKEELKKLKAMSGSFIGTQAYLAPEVYQKNYNEKIDIFSMGCVFYELYFLKKYRIEDWEKINNRYVKVLKDQEHPNNLEDDFMKIIFKMLIKDPNQRPNAKEIFNDIKEHYNEIFIHNSGLYASLRCLINLPNFNKKFLSKIKKIENFINKIYSNKYLFCVENKKDWIESLSFFRHKIVEENNFLNNNKEINPSIVISFLLEKLHGELNEVTKNKQEISYDEFNEENAKQEYIRYFLGNFSSMISDDFIGHLETLRKCNKCNSVSYLFTYFYMLSFDLNFPSLKNSKKKEIDVMELFSAQNKLFLNLKHLQKLKCNKCNKEEEHIEKKLFYCLPIQLILYFDRGYNCENQIKINYNANLDFSSIIRGKISSPTKYYLTGIIKRCDVNGKEHYISLIWNYSSDKKWCLYDNEKLEILNSFQDHKDGIIIMLFYASPGKH